MFGPVNGPMIYMDNHATTRVDPRVVEAMLPFFTETYGNPASVTHAAGWAAQEAVEAARQSLAEAVGASARELIFPSGATESNNLAIRGVAAGAQHKGRHIVSVATEHPSVLEPLAWLGRRGFEVTLLAPRSAPDSQAGMISAAQVAEAIRDETVLVSVMLANNEIGVIQPLAEIARESHRRGVLVHTDATQAVGKIPVDVRALDVDLMSFSAHKLYGPKGVGALYVRRQVPRIRLEPLLLGGGHEAGLRSGTLNVPGIVGFAKAVQICMAELPDESQRLYRLRNALYQRLAQAIPGLKLNGPALDPPDWRLPGNLNVQLPGVDAETVLMQVNRLAASTGSACTSANPEPSHVLLALGLRIEEARSSLRLGLGRFNTPDEVEEATAALSEAVARLQRMAGHA